MSLLLYNTLSRKIEEFKPIKKNKVGMYCCGPTVYNYAHIGNLRTYIFEDILKRVLKYDNFKVKHVINITDVGHLTSDADEGEDKMEKGARREGKSAWEIADFFIKAFRQDIADLNIEEPDIWCRATDHIKEQIKLIKKLEKKGFVYKTADGIYFDTSKLSDYGKLSRLNKDELMVGARVEIGGKKNPTDFALWKFSPVLQKRQMEWKSPWGIGFPGWHIECSAMSIKYLGQPFDIHCGGIDHIPVHHTNEIAQSEAAEEKPLANFWLHGEFLLTDKEKMAKSGENFLTLQTLKQKNINPIAYRYFVLQTHYRKQLNFSLEALEAAQSGLRHLYHLSSGIQNKHALLFNSVLSFPRKRESNNTDIDSRFRGNDKEETIEKNFYDAINNDLDTPAALALVWTALKDKTISLRTLLKFDEVLGLKIKENISEKKEETIPAEIQKLADERNSARAEKNWAKSDEYRKKLEDAGYKIEDDPRGSRVVKI
ncbi:MAG: cysteine--tRNA ligase [Patescibacteria group bacterium]|nr:cysteine--tRNA ligase [Patescibacteria group bacterium]